MEKQFCFNYEHYAALEGLPDADRKLVAEAQRATENAHAPYSTRWRRWPSLRIPPRASATPAASAGR